MTCRSTLVMQTGRRDARNALGLAIAMRGPLWMQKQQLLNGTAGSFITRFGPDIGPNRLRFFSEGVIGSGCVFGSARLTAPLVAECLFFSPGPFVPNTTAVVSFVPKTTAVLFRRLGWAEKVMGPLRWPK